jgi:hypothetical protein
MVAIDQVPQIKMNTPVDFENCEGYACFRPTGEVTFNEAVVIIGNAISQAEDKDLKRLLVVTTSMRGFPYPTSSERYYMADQWAARARGLILSMVARAEVIDPLRFGIMVARKKGLMANVFDSENEAVEWLLNPNRD